MSDDFEIDVAARIIDQVRVYGDYCRYAEESWARGADGAAERWEQQAADQLDLIRATLNLPF